MSRIKFSCATQSLGQKTIFQGSLEVHVELQHEMRKMMDSLRTERDNLRIKIHLGSMEAKDEFKEAEQKWQKLKAKASNVIDNIAESSHEMTGAAFAAKHRVTQRSLL